MVTEQVARLADAFPEEFHLLEKGTGMGRPSWRSSFLGDPGAEFLCGKRKLTKFREHLSQSR